MAPFSELARRYGEDLAILWIDSHPDVGTPESEYPGCHAVAVAALNGQGDPDVLDLLPSIVSPDRVALVRLHSWSDDDVPNVAEWGIQSFSPDELEKLLGRCSIGSPPTGCARVAIHFDVDTIDSNEIVLGLGAEPGGLTSAEVRRIIPDIDGAADIVGFTIAELIPRQVDAPATTPQRFPLISGTTAG